MPAGHCLALICERECSECAGRKKREGEWGEGEGEMALGEIEKEKGRGKFMGTRGRKGAA
jgi:hypothetical protein